MKKSINFWSFSGKDVYQALDLAKAAGEMIPGYAFAASTFMIGANIVVDGGWTAW